MSNLEPRMARKVTRDDVARLAGVSSAVVSYVINNGPRPVAAATRTRVEAAIEKLGYLPNAAARSLIRGRSDLLGLIVPDLANPYFASLAKAIETAARTASVDLILMQGDSGGLATLVETLTGHLVTGIITAALPEPEAAALALRSRVPLVKISQAVFGNSGTIGPDYYNGTLTAVRHLVANHGHRHVALVIGSDQLGRPYQPMDDRERGWRDALEHSGLPASHIVRTSWSAGGGMNAAADLALHHPETTAVFASSDQQAIGLLAGLRAAGMRTPEDIAVASFDGSPESEFTAPPLTTISVPTADIANAAVHSLLEGEGQRQRVFPTELVVRRSCGCDY